MLLAYILLSALAINSYAETLTCQNVTYLKDNRSFERSDLSGTVNLKTGNIRIAAGIDFPSVISIEGSQIFDSSFTAVIYNRDNCSTVKNIRDFYLSHFAIACVSDNGHRGIFAKLKINRSNIINTSKRGNTVITYSSRNSNGFLHSYELSSCK